MQLFQNGIECWNGVAQMLKVAKNINSEFVFITA